MNYPYRKFGCEFEFSTEFYDAEPIVRKAINEVYGIGNLHAARTFFYSNKNKKWHFKTDSSTETELTTPVSNHKDLSKICKVVKILKKNKKMKITQKDALHIHMHATDIPENNIIVAWIQIESAILRCFPKYRRMKRRYCPRLISEKKKNIDISKSVMRAIQYAEVHHSIISLFRYRDYGTAELRISECNLEANHIVNLVRFFNYFLNYSKTINPLLVACSGKKSYTTLPRVFDLLNADHDVEKYFLSRARKFRGD